MAQRNEPPSALLVEEYFEAGDPRFLAELLAYRKSGRLGALAARWYKDARPFARACLLDYIDEGCDQPHHRPLVKGLFKFAEAAGDDEAMGHFLVAFDRLTRRRIVREPRYDVTTRTVWHEYRLKRTKHWAPADKGSADREGRFSWATRRYLQRRAFRYFRRMGFRDLARYGRAMRAALVLYRDPTLETSEKLLDSWSLMHALYGGSDVLARDARGIRLARGRALKDLVPDPMHPAAWRGCFDELLEMLHAAGSRTVRNWLVSWLRAECAADIETLPVPAVRRLLASPHKELQDFGAALLPKVKGVENLTMDAWRELLSVQNLDALPTICDLAAKLIAPARLSFAECVELARSALGPVADLGLRWLRERAIRSEGDLSLALSVCDAPSPRVRAEAAEWLASLLASSPLATARHLRDMVDSRHAEVRASALAVLAAPGRFSDDLTLFAALSESPYDDARAVLVRRLDVWRTSFEPQTLRGLWATAMLSVHRGSRLKRTVLEQLSERIAAEPGDAEHLLPILAVALRSVREAERRAALAALVRAALRAPDLAPLVERALPELTIVSREVTR